MNERFFDIHSLGFYDAEGIFFYLHDWVRSYDSFSQECAVWPHGEVVARAYNKERECREEWEATPEEARAFAICCNTYANMKGRKTLREVYEYCQREGIL